MTAMSSRHLTQGLALSRRLLGGRCELGNFAGLCYNFSVPLCELGNRGLAFILDRNRLNVALSRAQTLAIVVADPNIAATPEASIVELALLNTFCRLVSA